VGGADGAEHDISWWRRRRREVVWDAATVAEAGPHGLQALPGPPPYHFLITKSAIPAGDFLTMVQFQSHGRDMGGWFGLKTGRQTTCVPQYAVAADPR
jgi:hypothetical protein